MNIDYNSENEDLISHISKRSESVTNELEIFLKIIRPIATTKPLNWWK